MFDTSHITAALLVTSLAMSGCSLLYPDPAPRPPSELPIDDAALHHALFDEDPEELADCTDRLDALFSLSICERSRTIRGETALCVLSEPWSSLRFGCVGEEGESARVELRTVDAEALQPMVDEALGRTCAPAANSVFLGERKPRWSGDRGELACFYVGSMVSYGSGLGAELPQGLFLGYNEEVVPADALSRPDDIEPVSLRVELERLDEPTRENVWRTLSLVMARSGELGEP